MRKCAAGGFTLIEVLIAIVILSFGILAVSSMQISAIGGNYAAMQVTEATVYAADKIEEIMRLGYTAGELSAGAHGPEANARHTVTWTVTEDVPLDGLKKVDIQVQADDPPKKKVSYTFYKVNSE